MADNTHAPSRSQLSQSSGHSPRSFATLSGGSSGGLSGYPPSLSNNRPPSAQAQQGSPRRPRGRPPGSKNRPKLKQETEEALKLVIIEIAAGNDVVKTIIAFAQDRRVGITVLSGTGSVSDVTLRHPVSRASAFHNQAPFNLLSLNGTYIGGRSPNSLLNSSFGICLVGSQGQVFGGIVGGKVTAATEVVVMATVFKKPEFHRFPFFIENAADHRSGVVNNSINNITNNTMINNNVIAMIPNMPAGFGVAVMNNVMQWY